ncbi:MAG: cytochrome c-type biogenesis CcmF C-terminal domain-containing protein, partial [Desulfonatronovibrionaceae bacterium]
GWGGYWAWDPVENASLIPWLVSTSFLHTALIGKQRNTLHKTNLILICLSLISCFFATFLVRSNIIDSLHSFGGGGLGFPLTVLMLVSLALTLFVAMTGQGNKKAVDSLWSKQGLMIVSVWLFLALAFIVATGTMWPVISGLWTDSPIGLGPDFYNMVCLPLFTLMAVLLCACPWFNWRDGISHRNNLLLVGVVFLFTMAGLYLGGIRMVLPIIAAAAGVAGIFSCALYILSNGSVRRRRTGVAAYLLHLGIAMIVLGVAFSGPFTDEREVVMAKDETLSLNKYEFHYESLEEILTPGVSTYQVNINVFINGEKIGELTPQRKLYRNFDSAYSEVSVIPSLGNELYSSILAFDEEDRVTLKLNIAPLVNWIWIGSILVFVTCFLLLARVRIRKDSAGNGQSQA